MQVCLVAGMGLGEATNGESALLLGGVRCEEYGIMMRADGSPGGKSLPRAHSDAHQRWRANELSLKHATM
jgi:hypothetical protein